MKKTVLFAFALSLQASRCRWRQQSQWQKGLHHCSCEQGGECARVDGARYDGWFIKGKYDGPGIYSDADGSRYDGVLSRARYTGKGVVYYSNGDRFGFADSQYIGFRQRLAFKEEPFTDYQVTKLFQNF